MSHKERNIKYLVKHRIIYRNNPVNDKPTEEYPWGYFYEDGTRECYTLFGSKAKITTYKSLKWHLYVLWYLNPDMDPEQFNRIAKFIGDKSNGFTTFNISDHIMESIIYDVSMQELDTPPPNKMRKIIFKDNTGLTTSEKLSIVGKLIGRSKITKSEIYETMLLLHDNKEKITITKLADTLGCSTRTIYRNITNELKKEYKLLNKQHEKI
jgi:hypothetical protein|tara:strand:- start:473 stop:1102 length:630 start_codon:yes stop_codon:yes gene_type:complete